VLKLRVVLSTRRN